MLQCVLVLLAHVRVVHLYKAALSAQHSAAVICLCLALVATTIIHKLPLHERVQA